MIEAKTSKSGRAALPFRQAAALIGDYSWTRISAQLRSAVPVILYLIAVQVLLLRVPIAQAGMLALGVLMVVVGLTAFLEGLMLAIMPMGDVCGVGLPRRARLPGIIAVVFLIGLLGTLAEPSIAVLQRMGSSVKPWDAPLLFVLLGRHSFLLVCAIGAGVGLAFALGILRSLRGWSLKPVLGICVAVVIAATAWAQSQPNLALMYSLAWDAGAITTSDVTVPLMLALGIGLSRMGGAAQDEGSGFGSVALASLVPILTVIALGAALLPSVPAPMSRAQFVSGAQDYSIQLFRDRSAYEAWAQENLTPAERAMADAGSVASGASAGDAEAASGDPAAPTATAEPPVLARTAIESARAVIPLACMLFIIVLLVLRQKLPWPDQNILGLAFCLAGMTLFTAGVEIGLLPLGERTGENLTALVKATEHPEKSVLIEGFDPSLAIAAVSPKGGSGSYLLLEDAEGPKIVPYESERYDEAAGSYLHVPRSPPLIPGIGGWIALLLVGLGLGFTTTLVEPAVAALGVTLENVTVGVFPRERMVLIVSAGVGVGTMAGFAMVVWNLPLLWLITPLYAAILVLTAFSTELFTGIAWDAGGATTASITTPLVLAVGAGLGGSLGTAESFGILTLASGFPILGVLLAGIAVSRRSSGRKGSAR